VHQVWAKFINNNDYAQGYAYASAAGLFDANAMIGLQAFKSHGYHSFFRQLVSVATEDESSSDNPSKRKRQTGFGWQPGRGRVPYNQRNNPPQHPRIVYPSILNINYFHHFLDILHNYNPMDDEPMWVADHVVAPTPSSAITIPETANEFAIKEIPKMSCSPDDVSPITHCEITQEVLNAAAGGIFLYKTPNQAYQLLEDKVLLKLDWAKNQKTKSSLKKTVAFADEGNSNSGTEKIMTRMDAMTIKMDAQYKELQS
ncbi:hypothetical protein Tco_0134345, partial [Tanacetum coccineum]